MSLTENPRAVIGDNRPDLTAGITSQLRRDHESLITESDRLLYLADHAPEVDNDEKMGAVAKLIKSLRDITKRIEATHAMEKAPYLRGGQAIDQFFFSMWDKCARRAKANKPGAMDILEQRIDDYNQRKLAAERERRRVEAEILARQEQERRAAEEKARREAEEARLAADRARKAEIVAAKGAVATQAEADAAAARTEADLASARAEDARIATLAKPADIVRTRVDEGPLVTMGTEPYAVVEDRGLLDMNVLGPFLTTAAIEQALRAWARSTDYRMQMPGARVGRRPKSVVR